MKHRPLHNTCALLACVLVASAVLWPAAVGKAMGDDGLAKPAWMIGLRATAGMAVMRGELPVLVQHGSEGSALITDQFVHAGGTYAVGASVEAGYLPFGSQWSIVVGAGLGMRRFDHQITSQGYGTEPNRDVRIDAQQNRWMVTAMTELRRAAWASGWLMLGGLHVEVPVGSSAATIWHYAPIDRGGLPTSATTAGERRSGILDNGTTFGVYTGVGRTIVAGIAGSLSMQITPFATYGINISQTARGAVWSPFSITCGVSIGRWL